MALQALAGLLEQLVALLLQKTDAIAQGQGQHHHHPERANVRQHGDHRDVGHPVQVAQHEDEDQPQEHEPGRHVQARRPVAPGPHRPAQPAKQQHRDHHQQGGQVIGPGRRNQQLHHQQHRDAQQITAYQPVVTGKALLEPEKMPRVHGQRRRADIDAQPVVLVELGHLRPQELQAETVDVQIEHRDAHQKRHEIQVHRLFQGQRQQGVIDHHDQQAAIENAVHQNVPVGVLHQAGGAVQHGREVDGALAADAHIVVPGRRRAAFQGEDEGAVVHQAMVERQGVAHVHAPVTAVGGGREQGDVVQDRVALHQVPVLAGHGAGVQGEAQPDHAAGEAEIQFRGIVGPEARRQAAAHGLEVPMPLRVHQHLHGARHLHLVAVPGQGHRLRPPGQSTPQ